MKIMSATTAKAIMAIVKKIPRKCPICKKWRRLQMAFDPYWMGEKHQAYWCEECIDNEIDRQHERHLENYYGGSAPFTDRERMEEARKMK